MVGVSVSVRTPCQLPPSPSTSMGSTDVMFDASATKPPARPPRSCLSRRGFHVNAIHRVGVIGAGLMGSGIAEVCALAGLDVVVSEVDQPALAAGQQRM